MNDLTIPEGFTIIERIPGHIIKGAPGAGKEANWSYKVKDKNEDECILLYCSPGIFTIVDVDKLKELQNYTWFVMKTGYPAAHMKYNEKKTVITLHAFIMNHIGNGNTKGSLSVDHINQNKLDNRIKNLRLATQSEQVSNRGKIARKSNARELPNGFIQKDLPKYIVYYNEKIYLRSKNPTDCRREFFRVESHPLQILKENNPELYSDDIKIAWASSKSNKITPENKLEEAKKYLEILNNLYKDEKNKKINITNNSEINNNNSEENKCKAILEQGINKGKLCNRQTEGQKFCGKHKKQELKEINSNKKKCSTHRCSNYLEINLTEIYCDECIKKKDEKKKEISNICKALIQQGNDKGKQCNREAINGPYCGKHERQIYYDDEKEKGIKYCDISRGCFRILDNDKKRCEGCLSRDREYDKKRYLQKKISE